MSWSQTCWLVYHSPYNHLSWRLTQTKETLPLHFFVFLFPSGLPGLLSVRSVCDTLPVEGDLHSAAVTSVFTGLRYGGCSWPGQREKDLEEARGPANPEGGQTPRQTHPEEHVSLPYWPLLRHAHHRYVLLKPCGSDTGGKSDQGGGHQVKWGKIAALCCTWMSLFRPSVLCFWGQGSVWSQTTTGAPRSTNWSSSLTSWSVRFVWNAKLTQPSASDCTAIWMTCARSRWQRLCFWLQFCATGGSGGPLYLFQWFVQ